MAIKYICDRCGAEIEAQKNTVKLTVWDESAAAFKDTTLDLCAECAKKIKTYISKT